MMEAAKRRLGRDVRSFCTECQEVACVHVVEALDDAEARAKTQAMRFEAMTALFALSEVTT